MKKHLVKFILISAIFVGGALATHTTRAEDKPAAAAEVKKERAIPFNGKINEIDKAAKTITIGKEKKRTIHIADSTKITKAGKSATFSDAMVGEEVGGSYREVAGKLEAASLRIGPKAEAAVKVETKKKKE